MFTYAPKALRILREIADEHDLLLILDEIATGFGRTGALFASEWAQAGAHTNFDRANLELAAANIDQARLAAASACAASTKLAETDASVAAWRIRLQLRCADVKARLALRSGDGASATDFARQALALARTEQNAIDRSLLLARTEMLLGDALRASGQRDAGRGAYQRAFSAWPKGIEERPQELADHASLLRRLNQTSEAASIAQRLSAMGYRHPDYRREF